MIPGMLQLFAHLIGDYWLQSDKQATGKKNSWKLAFEHGMWYMFPFIVLMTIWRCIHPDNPFLWIVGALIIWITHVLIDKSNIVVWMALLKNRMIHRTSEWGIYEIDPNYLGYNPDRPKHIVHWLIIIVDNSLHLMINYFALWLAFR